MGDSVDDRPGDPNPWNDLLDSPSRGQRYGVRHLMVLVAACALLFAVIAYFGWGLLVFVAAGLLVVVILGIFVLVLNQLRSQEDAILWAVVHAEEDHLPLAPGIEAFADLCGGIARGRSLALASRVRAGESLAEATAQVSGVFPRAARVYLWMGWDPQVLARALRDVAAARAEWQPLRHSLTMRIGYLGLVLLTLQGMTGFVLYWIVPRLEAIFADFGVELPRVTVAVILAANWIGHFWMPFFLLMLLELVLLIGLPLTFLDWFYWNVPLLDRLARRRHTAAVLRALSYGMEGGQPLPKLLGVLAHHYPSTWVRRRLARVRDDVAASRDWLASLRARGFLRGSEAAVLEAAQRVGNLPWALRELAEGIERRFGVKVYAGSQVLFPLLIMSMGGVVLLFATAFFFPLVTLIEKLAP